MRSLAMLFCIFLAGCAGSLGSLPGMGGESAPDWYEARKSELEGEGYPRLARVPLDASYSPTQTGLVQSAEEREAIRQAFMSDPRSAPVSLTPAQIRAWGRRKREQVASMEVAGNFLTDDEIAKLFSLFDRPRAR